MANALRRNLEESSSISIDSFCPTPNGVGTHPSIIGKCIMFFGNSSNKLKQLINEWFLEVMSEERYCLCAMKHLSVVDLNILNPYTFFAKFVGE